MSCAYDTNCMCSDCHAYRRAHDYRPACDCVDCMQVRAETCPEGRGREGTCDVRGRSCYTEGGCGCQRRGGSCSCGG